MFKVRGPMMVESVYDKTVTATPRTMSKDISIISQHTGHRLRNAARLARRERPRGGDRQGHEMSRTALVCAVLEAMAGVSCALRVQSPGP